MKFKSSAIALAVAGTIATPMAAQADLYASARVGIENVDTGGVSDLRVRSFASRLGVRSETDLGNGMTGFGNAYVHLETLSDDSANADPSLITLGYTQSLGRKTTAYYELVSNDNDTGNSDDDATILRAVLKYDIE